MSKKWFYYLNNPKEENLLSYYSKFQKNETNLYACHEKKNRMYAMFENHIELKNHIDSTVETEKCFYEILISDKPRKPYFDIDIENPDFDSEDFIRKLIESISKTIPVENTILVYESHWMRKKSFHIVVDKVFLKNEMECESFYFRCIENIPEKYQKYVDNGVYKKVQQFRLLGCHKYNKENTKKLNTDLSVNYNIPKNYKNSEKAISNYNFFISLIGNIVGCVYLEGFSVVDKKKISFVGSSTSGDLEEVLDLFYKKFPSDNYGFLNVFENSGSLLILLKRLNPSFCSLCNRFHEKENPYLTVTGIYRDINFYCRRVDKGNPNQKIFVGSLSIPEREEIIPEQVFNMESLYTDKHEKKISILEGLGEKIQLKKEETKRYKGNVSFVSNINLFS